MRRVVLCALDTTTAAGPVLDTAVRIGQLIGAEVEAVHVPGPRRGDLDVPRSLAGRLEVPFRLLEGRVGPALLAALDEPGVVAAVMGARATPGGRRPVGRTARHVLEHAGVPVVIVPPDATSPGVLRRLLVPLDGTDVSSHAVLDRLRPLVVAEVELLVLHVFTEATRPAMLDHPEYDLPIFATEFLTRHCPGAAGIELRPGPVGTRVVEVSDEHDVDLVVLSWAQNAWDGRARVVREVLGASSVPILLLPETAVAVGPDDVVGTNASSPPEDEAGSSDHGERRDDEADR